MGRSATRSVTSAVDPPPLVAGTRSATTRPRARSCGSSEAAGRSAPTGPPPFAWVSSGAAAHSARLLSHGTIDAWKARRANGKLELVRRNSALVPQDKYDIRAAERARNAGWPAVEPVLGELVDWCVDSNWPVAHVLGPFLGALGAPVMPRVRAILEGDDAAAKYHILCGIVGAMPFEVRAELRGVVSRLAGSSTADEAAEGVPEIAAELLADPGGGPERG
jgi:hypothetical protein